MVVRQRHPPLTPFVMAEPSPSGVSPYPPPRYAGATRVAWLALRRLIGWALPVALAVAAAAAGALLLGYPTPAATATTTLCLAGVVAPRSYPRAVGHRGAEGVAPENTLPALTAGAAAVGIVETDVTVSADGTAWLFHDETLDAQSNGTGRPCAATDAVLGGVRVAGGAAYGLANVTASLTRLAPALTAVGGGVDWMLDVKTCGWPGGPPPAGTLPAGVTTADAPADPDGCVACPALVGAIADALDAAGTSLDAVVFTSTQPSALAAVRSRWPAAATVLSRDAKAVLRPLRSLLTDFAPWTGGALEWRLAVARPDLVAALTARPGGRVYGWTVRGGGGVAGGGVCGGGLGDYQLPQPGGWLEGGGQVSVTPRLGWCGDGAGRWGLACVCAFRGRGGRRGRGTGRVGR